MANGYNQEFRLPILQLTAFDPNENIISFDEHYTRAQIDALHGLWGIRYREIYGYNVGGQRTSVRVITWNNTDFTTTSWTNGIPTGGGGLTMDRVSVVSPIIANEDENIDVSELMMEDSFGLVRQYESLDKFDLRVSRATFQLDESTELTAFLDKYWNPGGYEQKQYMIGIEIEGYFWGFSDYENINYDAVEKTYHFDCYDPIKFLQKHIWSLPLPSLGVSNANLEYFLTVVCGLFIREGKTVIVDVNDSQNWSYDYVGGHNSDTETYYTLDSFLSIEDFIVECLKHYGATIYYNANGDLVFAGREKTNDWTHDARTVMLEDLNKSYQGQEYDGLIINVQGDWRQSNSVYVHYEGWALIWEEQETMQSKTLSADLREIPENFRHLDLRQKLPEYDFAYRVFGDRTRDEVYVSYKELLRNSQIYETTLDGIDYLLFDKLRIDGQDYVINYIDTDIVNQNSRVRVYKSL